MKENISSISFIKDAFRFKIQQRNPARYEGDMYPMSGSEILQLIVTTVLSKEKMKQLICNYSSYNYGTHLLTSVFPKADNPDEFHSRNGVIRLDEHPLQAMGWKEYEQLIEDGVKMGLDESYISRGFEEQARKRGIDLEWAFFAEVPQESPKPELPS
jgi:hypothetical protein